MTNQAKRYVVIEGKTLPAGPRFIVDEIRVRRCDMVQFFSDGELVWEQPAEVESNE